MTGRNATTRLLQRLSEGDESVSDELYAEIRAELYRLARMHMARRGRDHTLQSTALVHEAWMRLADAPDASWRSRGHFYAMASKVMRSILVDHARTKRAEKRGGGVRRIPVADRATEEMGFTAGDVLDLHAALEKLEGVDPERARVLELRYFGGLTVEEIARATDVPLRTVERRIRAATAWMRSRLED